MTKTDQMYNCEVDSCQSPDPVLHCVEYFKDSHTFQAMSEDDQIAYCCLLVEAEEWAESYGYKTPKFKQGGSYD